MKVSIVIPNWNGLEKLKKNLPKVLEIEGVFEVIVSDDASTDESVNFLVENFPTVKVIKREKNGGFSSNVNTGMKYVSSELVMLLNSDAVPERDCLKYIIPHFKEDRVFSVGLSAGGGFSWARFKNGYFWHGVGEGDNEGSHETLWVSGGSGVFRVKYWREMGGLDTLYDPFYEEDVDIGYKAWKRGYINVFEPKAKVEHYKEKGVIEENFSKSKISNVAMRNQLIFIWKNITEGKLILKHIFFLILRILAHPKYLVIFLRAFYILPVILNKRSKESKFIKLSDSKILAKYQVKTV